MRGSHSTYSWKENNRDKFEISAYSAYNRSSYNLLTGSIE